MMKKLLSVLLVLPEFLPVTGEERETVGLICEPPALLLKKGSRNPLHRELSLPESVEAPVEEGEVVGTVSFCDENGVIAVSDVRAGASVRKIGFSFTFNRILTTLFGIF